MTELLHQPGFLGTSANFAADMTLVLSLLVAAALTLGFLLARRGDFRTHRVVQTVAVLTNAVLVLWLMILPFRDFVAPGVPERLGERFIGVTTLHAAVGASALLLGVFVMLRANGLMPKPLRFPTTRVMRISYALHAGDADRDLVCLTWFVEPQSAGLPDRPALSEPRMWGFIRRSKSPGARRPCRGPQDEGVPERARTSKGVNRTLPLYSRPNF
jgi:uncharacterized membrane protein